MAKTEYMTIGELKRILRESNEFKAKIGAGVTEKEKSQNQEAYREAKKRAKDFDGGLADKVSGYQAGKADYKKEDGNGTLLDYNPENADKKYKDRVKAQVEGYTSELEKNNGLEKSGDYSGNKDIYDGIKKTGKEMHTNRKNLAKSGLQARQMPDKTFDREEMYESKAPMKRAKFRKTAFLSENHMYSKIPDSFKTEGNQFIMEDKNGWEFIVKWDTNHPMVISESNKKGVSDAVKRMMEMATYRPNGTENKNCGNTEDIISEMRQGMMKIMENQEV